MNSKQYFRTKVHVSNITDNTLSGTITLYDTTGSIFYDDNSTSGGNIESVGFDTYAEGTGAGGTTVSFTIAPHSTGSITLVMKTSPNPVWFEGYGIIEWKNVEGNDVYGLVAQAHCNFRMAGATGLENSYAISVNNGMPF